MSIDINPVIRNLEAREWIQGEMQRGESVCAHGAVQTCKTLQPGDEHIIHLVMRQQGLTEDWNDEPGRTKAEVLAKFQTIEVSDAALVDTFGPQALAIVALVRRSAVLTEDEASQLAAARDAAARAAAWAAAWAADRDAARDAAAQVAAWPAVALVVRDLIGQHGFTQEHYDILTGPWASVIGKVHPDDKETDR